MLIRRYTTKELRKESCIEALYAFDCEYRSSVSNLVLSLIDAEQCRRSMASMVFEGVHNVVLCLSKFFQALFK